MIIRRACTADEKTASPTNEISYNHPPQAFIQSGTKCPASVEPESDAGAHVGEAGMSGKALLLLLSFVSHESYVKILCFGSYRQ